MKLTTRFLILTGILGLAVIVTLAVAYWGVATVDREVRMTYGEITRVLARLELIKRNFEAQTQALQYEDLRIRRLPNLTGADRSLTGSFIEGPGALDVELIEDRSESTEAAMQVLRDEPAFMTSVQTPAVIGREVELLQGLIRECLEAYERDDVTAFSAAVEAASGPFERLHLRIEQLEARMLEDIESSLEHAQVIRVQMNLVFMSVLSVAAMVFVLVLLLQRRWFNKPIRALRQATVELSRGNFEHRIPIDSRDELGLLSHEVNDMAGTITEIQHRLIERERLAAIGEMMRRIVHNLRNPLAGIRSLAELTRSELPDDSDEYENQQRILNTVDRFERWLEEVLHSTRPLDVRPESGSPREFLASVVEPQRDTARGKDVEFVVALDGLPACARFDAVHLQHAVIALVANAIEATPGGGTVKVIGDSDAIAERDAWRITIEDSGPGIDPESRHRIFEPYFTTKRHGTGIGLAVVRNVVEAHRGEIAVSRAESGGARFVVTLPC